MSDYETAPLQSPSRLETLQQRFEEMQAGLDMRAHQVRAERRLRSGLLPGVAPGTTEAPKPMSAYDTQPLWNYWLSLALHQEMPISVREKISASKRGRTYPRNRKNPQKVKPHPVFIAGVPYRSFAAAGRAHNVSAATVRYRISSEYFPDWMAAPQPESA